MILLLLNGFGFESLLPIILIMDAFIMISTSATYSLMYDIDDAACKADMYESIGISTLVIGIILIGLPCVSTVSGLYRVRKHLHLNKRGIEECRF